MFALLLLMIGAGGCGENVETSDDRIAARWALGLGGTVTLLGKLNEVKQLDELPTGPLTLQRINLNQTAVADEELQKLAHMSSLKSLALSETAISDDGLEYVIAVPSITELELSYTEVTDAGIVKLKRMPNLSKLFVTGTKITEAAAELFREERPNCEVSRVN